MKRYFLIILIFLTIGCVSQKKQKIEIDDGAESYLRWRCLTDFYYRTKYPNLDNYTQIDGGGLRIYLKNGTTFIEPWRGLQELESWDRKIRKTFK